mmetsp:Transcript_57984/g.138036  ORF Transcript_57984/g.138036 Transcript_57984/m.138036 type:complete len:294 (+) Transcript_57984:1009-1890(+)
MLCTRKFSSGHSITARSLIMYACGISLTVSSSAPCTPWIRFANSSSCSGGFFFMLSLSNSTMHSANASRNSAASTSPLLSRSARRNRYAAVSHTDVIPGIGLSWRYFTISSIVSVPLLSSSIFLKRCCCTASMFWTRARSMSRCVAIRPRWTGTVMAMARPASVMRRKESSTTLPEGPISRFRTFGRGRAKTSCFVPFLLCEMHSWMSRRQSPAMMAPSRPSSFLLCSQLSFHTGPPSETARTYSPWSGPSAITSPTPHSADRFFCSRLKRDLMFSILPAAGYPRSSEQAGGV